MPSQLQTVSSLEALLATVESKAGQVYSPTAPATQVSLTSLSNTGTLNSPQTIYVDGNLTLSGTTTGYGILVVTGTLTFKGNFSWNGVVLVIPARVFSTQVAAAVVTLTAG